MSWSGASLAGALARMIVDGFFRVVSAIFSAPTPNAVAFAVNVDRPTGKALVHRTDCEYYVSRRTKKPEDGGWEGPFRDRGDAFALARDTGMREARGAGCCNP